MWSLIRFVVFCVFAIINISLIICETTTLHLIDAHQNDLEPIEFRADGGVSHFSISIIPADLVRNGGLYTIKLGIITGALSLACSVFILIHLYFFALKLLRPLEESHLPDSYPFSYRMTYSFFFLVNAAISLVALIEISKNHVHLEPSEGVIQSLYPIEPGEGEEWDPGFQDGWGYDLETWVCAWAGYNATELPTFAKNCRTVRAARYLMILSFVVAVLAICMAFLAWPNIIQKDEASGGNDPDDAYWEGDGQDMQLMGESRNQLRDRPPHIASSQEDVLLYPNQERLSMDVPPPYVRQEDVSLGPSQESLSKNMELPLISPIPRISAEDIHLSVSYDRERSQER